MSVYEVVLADSADLDVLLVCDFYEREKREREK